MNWLGRFWRRLCEAFSFHQRVEMYSEDRKVILQVNGKDVDPNSSEGRRAIATMDRQMERGEQLIKEGEQMIKNARKWGKRNG